MGSFVDIIFLMILVAFIITRLYGVFGSNSNEEKIRFVVKPMDKEAEKKLMDNIAKVIKESKQEQEKECETVNFENLSELDKNLMKIPDFNKDNFMRGACRVFEVVLHAFNSGNITGIKNLLSKKIWDALNQTINFRKENNITSEVDFICFDKSEIKDVKLLKNSAKIAVEFVSEQINILKNSEGEVIEGDENFVQKITDIWTFERALNAKNNQWVLVSTKKSA